jgi:hypothetical protein
MCQSPAVDVPGEDDDNRVNDNVFCLLELRGWMGWDGDDTSTHCTHLRFTSNAR